MAEGDGAAVGVDPRVVVGQAQFAQHGQALGGEGFVEFDHVHVGQGQAGQLQHLARCRDRADAHDARLDAGGGHADHPGAGLEAVALGRFGAGQQQGAGAVVDARGVAGGDAAALAEGRAQLGQLLQGGVAARVLVLLDEFRRALALGNLHRDDFPGQAAIGLGGGGALLAAQGEGILVFAGDAELLGDVLGGLRHGVDAELAFHQRVDEAPADGGVEDFRLAGERAFRLAHDEGRAGHGFHAAGQHQPGFAAAQGAGGVADGVQAGAAEAVQGGAGDAQRQAGEQGRHARDVAVVFAGLVGAAVDHVVDGAPVQFRVAGHQGADRHGAEVVGAHAGQGAGVAADGRAHGVDDQGVIHQGSPARVPGRALCRTCRGRGRSVARSGFRYARRSCRCDRCGSVPWPGR
ncbi:hypothetical protein D9M70_408330 [compost metagenome]